MNSQHPPHDQPLASSELVAISEAELAALKATQLKNYLTNHKDWCREWAAHHDASQPFPIAYNHKSQPVWLNRAARRKLK